jgi:hypothetical protein
MRNTDNEDVVPKFFGIDSNRLVAFLGPHIAWIAGAAATWLMNQLDIFATFDVSNESLAGAIAQALTFGVVTLVVWLGEHKWLDGFQKWAYGVYEDIADTELPDTYTEAQAGPGTSTEAVAGFGAGEPPVDG